jgi:hypothetical protein
VRQTFKPLFSVAIIGLLLIAFFSYLLGNTLSEEYDNTWVAYPLHTVPFAGTASPHGLSPAQLRTAYNLPESGGGNKTIAIVAAYDTPSILDDFNSFSNRYNLPDNGSGNLLVYKMTGTAATDFGWGQETCLDVEWAHAIAPNATIALVEAKDSSGYSLYQAVDYAASIPGVVAVSMSWGGSEFLFESSRDFHFNKTGIVFFASSGDNKTAMYPACSPYVVAVGGTKVTFDDNGTLVSETAWSLSGGGPSLYETIPEYQAEYGLNYSTRAIPDVSYVADPSSGVSVYYDGSWYIFGGTSVGAPQWAAIHALGISSTHVNLYQKAKSAYSSYFRDITTGANEYNATIGYDYVTGLGSPLTYSFGTNLDLFPASGPGGADITLSGTGFTPQSSVNISYLNPLNSTWISIVDNLPTETENFTYPLKAPDLAQTNIAGDNDLQFDSIKFQAQDNSNGKIYNSSIPFTEMRRGLIQIGNETAQKIYGNNTDFATKIFVKDNDSLPLSGEWFHPGLISLLLDLNETKIIMVDEQGSFNTSLQIPIVSAGPHTLTIRDNSTTLSVNITRLPSLLSDYIDEWHTSDFQIDLMPDYPLNDVFYRVNTGPIQSMMNASQPFITDEATNNTLEYWGFWDVYGTTTMELEHHFISGIKLDKTPPVGTISTDPITSTIEIALSLNATDLTSGISGMRFSNDNSTWSNWEPYQNSKTYNLQLGNGQKTIFVQFADNAGLISTYDCTVTLQILQPPQPPTPTPSPLPSLTPTSTPSPTPEPTLGPTQEPNIQEPTPIPSPNTPTPSANSNSNSQPTQNPMQTTPTPSESPQPTEQPEIPEISNPIYAVIFLLITLSLATLVGKWKKSLKAKE